VVPTHSTGVPRGSRRAPGYSDSTRALPGASRQSDSGGGAGVAPWRRWLEEFLQAVGTDFQGPAWQLGTVTLVAGTRRTGPHSISATDSLRSSERPCSPWRLKIHRDVLRKPKPELIAQSCHARNAKRAQSDWLLIVQPPWSLIARGPTLRLACGGHHQHRELRPL